HGAGGREELYSLGRVRYNAAQRIEFLSAASAVFVAKRWMSRYCDCAPCAHRGRGEVHCQRLRTQIASGGWIMAPVESAETNPDRFAHVLGLAALDLWSELPRELQQALFERAVVLGHQTERDESLREQLAQFLHDHHERTAGR